jgi:hypothetical protein
LNRAQSIAAWHHNIHQDERGPVGVRRLDGLIGVGRFQRRKTFGVEKVAQKQPNVGAVIYDEDTIGFFHQYPRGL